MSATLPELVADALFQSEPATAGLGRPDCEKLGWRIVRTGVTVHEQVDSGPTQSLAFITDEWLP